jgi:streptomycin 6-kinase
MAQRYPLAPVHPGLEWLRASSAGRAWLERLPSLLDECRKQWSLDLEEPFSYAFASLAVPAGDVVLKIQFPDRESEHEGAALEVLDGAAAVRLVAHDPERRALLLERCRPGTPLKTLPADEAIAVFVDLLPRWWKPARGQFRTVAEEATWWLERLEETWERARRPFERRLLDAALSALRELPQTQGETVLVNQDLHADNVLAAEREPWLLIDPKPLVAEREFGIASLVRGSELGHDARSVCRRLERLTDELGLDRERARGWAIGQTIAWSGMSGGAPRGDHVEVARWLLQAPG